MAVFYQPHCTSQWRSVRPNTLVWQMQHCLDKVLELLQYQPVTNAQPFDLCQLESDKLIVIKHMFFYCSRKDLSTSTLALMPAKGTMIETYIS